MSYWKTVWKKRGNPEGRLDIHKTTGTGEFIIERRHIKKTTVESIEIDKSSLLILANNILSELEDV